MNDNDIIKAFDILDKFEFFGGQRAGRELWFNKPADIQEKDIGGFNRDIDFLKAFINRQKAEIERLREYYKLYFERKKEIEELNTQVEHLNGNLKFVRGTAERQLAEIERLTGYNKNLQTANTALSNEILDIRNATIKEFAEYLCDGRVSNDPVVIAAKCAVKELTEGVE